MSQKIHYHGLFSTFRLPTNIDYHKSQNLGVKKVTGVIWFRASHPKLGSWQTSKPSVSLFIPKGGVFGLRIPWACGLHMSAAMSAESSVNWAHWTRRIRASHARRGAKSQGSISLFPHSSRGRIPFTLSPKIIPFGHVSSTGQWPEWCRVDCRPIIQVPDLGQDHSTSFPWGEGCATQVCKCLLCLINRPHVNWTNSRDNPRPMPSALR